MPCGRLARLGVAIHPPPAAHDALDVLRSAGAPDAQQPLLGLRRRDAGERPDLGVRELAAREGTGQAGQGAERPGDAHLLARGAGVEADAPAQPVGAGGEAVAPALARVELSDEIQKTRGGGFEVRRELGDFVAETIERGGRAGEREHVCGEHVHGESPPAEATLHRDFGGSC